MCCNSDAQPYGSGIERTPLPIVDRNCNRNRTPNLLERFFREFRTKADEATAPFLMRPVT
jgi:hypothetical protein